MKSPDDDGPIYLTEAGFSKLKNRLAALKAALPAHIAEATRTAAEGDRSDNDAYKQSKALLRRTQRQIWTIEEQLKRVEIIKLGRNAKGTIQLGSRVILETAAGAKQTYQIVGPRETNPAQGRISQESPLGKALLGHVENETITIKTENGSRLFKILEVS